MNQMQSVLQKGLLSQFHHTTHRKINKCEAVLCMMARLHILAYKVKNKRRKFNTAEYVSDSTARGSTFSNNLK